jgi:hypothetical protein
VVVVVVVRRVNYRDKKKVIKKGEPAILDSIVGTESF